jgi:hypothetical protein
VQSLTVKLHIHNDSDSELEEPPLKGGAETDSDMTEDSGESSDHNFEEAVQVRVKVETTDI